MSKSRASESALETSIDRSALEKRNPGVTALHRLNRAEYANAIHDLLAIDVDAATILPPDDSSEGLDNIADVLSVSPGLLERYMSAANKISHLVVGDSRIRPAIQTYSAPKYLVQDDRMDEELPFGSRGGSCS